MTLRERFYKGLKMADSRATAGSLPVPNQDWLVGNPSGAGAAAALWIGSAGLLILGVIPILYGGAARRGADQSR